MKLERILIPILQIFEDAIEELKKNKYSTILSIALSVGFNSNSAFYSAFKKVTGKSPSDYREQ